MHASFVRMLACIFYFFYGITENIRMMDDLVLYFICYLDYNIRLFSKNAG